MKRIVLFIMPLIAMLLGMNACKGNDPVQPAEKKARYTIMVYGNAGGSMDSYIEHLWERTKPLMKSKDVRLGFFYKYGKKVDGAEFKTIAADLKTAFDKIWISRRHLIYNQQAPLSEFTLSLFMMDKEAYAQKVSTYQYTYKDAYEYSRFHKQSGWGNWINTNTHRPQGNPTGQIL